MKTIKNNIKILSALRTLGTSVLALFASLAIAGIIIRLSGYNPMEVYYLLFAKSIESKSSIALFLSESTPLIFAGLSFAVALKVGLVNVGVEGQLIMGAMFAALVGGYMTFIPGKLLLIASLMAGIIGGGLVALFTTVLKVKTGASEIITGIMLNNIINYVTLYLANGPLKPEGVSIGQTQPTPPSAYLTKLVPRSQLTTAFLIAIVVAIIMHIMFKKTVLGYKMRVTGFNRVAGVVAGIKPEKNFYISSFIYGGIAGLGGAGITLGVYHMFIEGISGGLGFSGIPVAALAAYSPIAIPISGIIFGILKAGTITLSRTSDVPLEIVGMIQALVVVFVSAPRIVTSIKDWEIVKKIKLKKTIVTPGTPTTEREGDLNG